MSIVWVIMAAGVLAFALSALATSLSRSVAIRVGMLDKPERRKAHVQPVPMLGGSAFFLVILAVTLLGTAAVSLWSGGHHPGWMSDALSRHLDGAAARAPRAVGILLAALVLHVVGLVDDKKNLGPWLKLLVELLVAAVVVLFLNVRVLTVAGPAISIAASVVWLVAITNAFNFLDNVDGLAAGVALIVAVSLLAAAASVGQIFVPAWLAIIAGALAGFLLHNFPPAKVYMGDNGSLVIGFLLGVLSSLTTYVEPGETYYSYGIFVPLIVMAVPIYDMISVVTLRIRDRRNPMVGDRRHFSHRLIRRGMSLRKAVLTIYLCTGATAIAASLLGRVGTVGAVLIACQTVAVLLILALLESGDVKP